MANKNQCPAPAAQPTPWDVAERRDGLVDIVDATTAIVLEAVEPKRAARIVAAVNDNAKFQLAIERQAARCNALRADAVDTRAHLARCVAALRPIAAVNLDRATIAVMGEGFAALVREARAALAAVKGGE